MKKSKSKTSASHTIVKHRTKQSFSHAAKKSAFTLSRDYSIFAVTLLLLSTVFWAYLSAKLQSSNADQLVNSYLFESAKTFRDAALPSAHSFFIKWPVFLLVKIMGTSAAVFITATVTLSLITIGSLAYILYRIDRRPAVFGTLCLCLASVLLLVPPAPYPGGILPVNMAMLATRNIEYVFYIGSLIFISRASRFKSYSFWLGVIVLILLAASDKLFLTISLGGSLLAVITYTAVRRWILARLATRWLVASVVAAVGVSALIWAINASGITHIIGTDSPFSIVHTARSLGLGFVFGGLGVLTNFGANPAFDAAVLRNIPHITQSRLFAIGGFSFITNIVIFLFTAGLSIKLYFSTLFRSGAQNTKTDHPLRLAAMLLFSSIAAIGAFIGTDHYYVVDARYLTIVLFAVFVSSAVYLRTIQIKSFRLFITAATLVTISLLVGLYSFYHIYRQQKAGLAAIDHRNVLIIQALKSHPVDTLVGDYWRVMPIHATQPNMSITPLDNCTHQRDILSSKNWQLDLSSHSFAYLISFDKSLTNYPTCSLDEVLNMYGRPNSSVLIEGTVEHPRELVLFYDRGAHKGPSPNNAQTILPITLQQLPQTDCANTIMNIVAHEDDDLLFLSPDLMHDIRAKHCIRTVYITAGDAGNSQLYWLARERGSEAAYSKLLGTDTPWVQRTIKLADNQFVTIANPKGNPEISLIFMRLADGRPDGEGYTTSHHESLKRLEAGQVQNIHSVDSQSSYTSNELVNAMKNLMELYQPAEIRTQATFSEDPLVPDHSDHMVVGRYVGRAYKDFNTDLPVTLRYYLGYPIRIKPENVTGQDLDSKIAAFLAYTHFDPATCRSKVECNETGSYGAYLKRQYIAP